MSIGGIMLKLFKIIFTLFCSILLSCNGGGGSGSSSNKEDPSSEPMPTYAYDYLLESSTQSFSNDPALSGSCKINANYGYCTTMSVQQATDDYGFDYAEISTAMLVSISNCNEYSLRMTYYVGSTCSGDPDDIIFTKNVSGNFVNVSRTGLLNKIKFQTDSFNFKFELGSNYQQIKQLALSATDFQYLLTDHCSAGVIPSNSTSNDVLEYDFSSCNNINFDYFLILRATQFGLYLADDNYDCPSHSWTDNNNQNRTDNICANLSDLDYLQISTLGIPRLD